MAQRRMFSLQIVDTDIFLEMPPSTQNLYFHLGMRADDDGFISNPKKIMKTVGAQEDDLKILFTKRFIIGFESGIIVIKHWRIHNYIAKDRYNETAYLEEKSLLDIKENGSYTECIQNVDTGKVSQGEVSLVKVRKGKARSKCEFTIPSLQQVIDYFIENGYKAESGEKAYNYYNSADWIDSKGAPVRNWKQKMQGVWFKDENKIKSEKSSEQLAAEWASKYNTGDKND